MDVEKIFTICAIIMTVMGIIAGVTHGEWMMPMIFAIVAWLMVIAGKLESIKNLL